MKICIIAGEGDLPKDIALKLPNAFVICFEGISKASDFKNKNEEVSIFRFEYILKLLKHNEITHLIFSGKFYRPYLINDKYDKTFKDIYEKTLNKGDNTISKLIISFFEEKGYKIISPKKIMEENFIKKKIIISRDKNKEKIKHLKKSSIIGINLLKKISEFDIGQSVVVSGSHIIGIEGLEGTNSLIKRCGKLFENNTPLNFENGLVLVKFPKKNQNLDLDLPVIGIDTIKYCLLYNFIGIVISSVNTLVLNKDKVIKYIKKNDIYLYCVGE